MVSGHLSPLCLLRLSRRTESHREEWSLVQLLRLLSEHAHLPFCVKECLNHISEDISATYYGLHDAVMLIRVFIVGRDVERPTKQFLNSDDPPSKEGPYYHQV